MSTYHSDDLVASDSDTENSIRAPENGEQGGHIAPAQAGARDQSHRGNIALGPQLPELFTQLQLPTNGFRAGIAPSQLSLGNNVPASQVSSTALSNNTLATLLQQLQGHPLPVPPQGSGLPPEVIASITPIELYYHNPEYQSIHKRCNDLSAMAFIRKKISPSKQL
ncbi:hypothetical protein BC834DRAFT_971837 [Gloeopeniophorella convolvens]|nr:hypothetical protein BC834DRAFT_971837 [Gloeopeniophorella convolvens]